MGRDVAAGDGERCEVIKWILNSCEIIIVKVGLLEEVRGFLNIDYGYALGTIRRRAVLDRDLIRLIRAEAGAPSLYLEFS